MSTIIARGIISTVAEFSRHKTKDYTDFYNGMQRLIEKVFGASKKEGYNKEIQIRR
jgi:hypothetical protein